MDLLPELSQDRQPGGLRRRLHVRLSPAMRAELARRASSSGMPISVMARHLIETGLTRTVSGQADSDDHKSVAIAALVAAELAVLMVASVLPEGEWRMHELSAPAAAAAEKRLALFRESGQ